MKDSADKNLKKIWYEGLGAEYLVVNGGDRSDVDHDDYFVCNDCSECDFDKYGRNDAG